MWVRKRLDIGWRDLGFGILRCAAAQDRRTIRRRIERSWSGGDDALVCLSVRSGFDLLLGALGLPPGSEVLLSALTIGDMVRIVEHHGLVPVPVDLDVARMAPTPQRLRRAITPQTRAIVVAHLFGSRIPLEPILEVAGRHGLLVIEDCAQAFAGREYRGHPDADVAMFSFGPIKTATALGGGLLRVRRGKLLERMRAEQASRPVQSRWHYLRRLLKYTALKAFSTRPVFRILVGGCRAVGCNHDRLINGAVRGFAGPRFLTRIRRQPSAPLLALLERRLETFDSHRAARRASMGNWLARLLDRRIECPTAGVVPHTHWVFPITTDDPRAVIAALAKAGFDATQGQSLCVVAPPADRPGLEATAAGDALAKIVFLPLYPEMPARSLERMARVLLREFTEPAPGKAAGDQDADCHGEAVARV